MKDRADASQRCLWHRANEIFQDALDRPSSERESFVRLCGEGDSHLIEDVLALLAAHDSSGFLSTPIPHLASQLLGRDYPKQFVGKRIGSFHVERWIASGGMGDVYLARRDHDGFDQRVAIKILKRGMDSNELAERFRRERRTLAALEHPNIARLIDGGITPDARPYYAMEYVDGVRIDHYCDEAGLTIVERLRLFVAVCRAVHYAHTNLVVHRDLKPNNILVTGDGVPKLLDFGIAKLLSPDLDEESTLTRSGDHRLLTPRYASPEQMRGECVTTTSDVYSLGLVLFKLLTGKLPKQPGTPGAPGGEVVCASIPVEPPSRAILRTAERHDSPHADGSPEARTSSGVTRDPSARSLRRQLRGDIDNIVCMALRCEPALRYESAEQFASDILRHLDRRPVIACRDTIRYRASKFVRRNKASVVSAMLLLITLTAGIVATSWQARLARVQRDLAMAERDHAETVTSFLQTTLLSASPFRRGADTNLYELLHDAEARLELELAGDRKARADVQHAIGKAYAALEIPHLAEKHLRAAIASYRQLYGTTHGDLAECLTVLGSMLAAQTNNESVAILTESLDMRRELFGDRHVLVADTQCQLARAYYGASRPVQLQRAETLLKDSEVIYRKHSAVGDMRLADWNDHLGRLRMWQNRFEEAITLHLAALATYRDANNETHPRVPLILRHLGWAYANSGRYAAAREIFDRYGTQMRTVYGSGWEHEGAWPLAHLDIAEGNPADALRRYHLWLVGRCRSIRSHFEVDSDAHSILQMLSEIEDPVGHPGLAAPYRELLTRLGERHLLPDLRAPGTMFQLGQTYYQLGAYSDAAILLRGCITLRKTLLPDAPCTLAHRLLSATLAALQEHDEADKHLLTARGLFTN